jgi:DNA-binding transcriptional MerR regulator
MTHSREPFWTLDDLGARVALALAVGYSGQANGRVRDIPDRRTIRYYTTLGLIDRAAAMRGRTALYGLRHLLQLVAIKRLQANGLSLSEIQQRLVGVTDAALRQVARLPPDFDPGQALLGDNAVSTDESVTDRNAAPFWSAAPAAAAVESDEAPEMRRDVAPVLVGVPLETGVTLLLESRRPLDEHDLSTLRLAAAPLLKFLHVRRLVGGEEATSTKGETS